MTILMFYLASTSLKESLLDSYTLWGTHWSWSHMGFYKIPNIKVLDDIISKYGGWWSILKIYLSLAPVKFKVIKRCRQMTKMNYHDVQDEVLNTPLKHLERAIQHRTTSFR